MGGNSLYSMMDLMITVCGLYVVIQYFIMKSSGKIPQNMLMPKDLDVNKCKDTQGYIRYIGIRQLAFGVMAAVCGVIGLIQDYTGKVSVAVTLLTIAAFLACCFWYGFAMKKARKEFWGC